jgi:glycosyltransferase involved in cell wall biosynthesis
MKDERVCVGRLSSVINYQFLCMRQVLILTYDFPPRGATGVFRVTKFARYLPQFGWQPVVVTAAGDGGVQDAALLRELPPHIEVLRVPHPLGQRRADHRGTEVRRIDKVQYMGGCAQLKAQARRLARHVLLPDPQALWLPAAMGAATARLRHGDIAAMLTTSPPHSIQLAGLSLKRRFPNVPWIMDMRDVWSDSPTIGDPLTYKINRVLERRCLDAADRVVVVTEAMRRLLQREYGTPAQHITTITNGFDAQDIGLQPPMQHKALHLAYVGTIIGTRAPAARGLFTALQQLADNGVDRETLVLRCYGQFDPQIHEWATPLIERGVVELHPFVPHAAAVAAMAAADVLVLLMTDDWEGRIAVPNKLYEYLAVGRPVLALSPPGEVTRLVETHNMGIAVPPFDIDAIVGALQRMIGQHRAGTLPRFAPNDPRLGRFERRELTRRLAALLDETVN